MPQAPVPADWAGLADEELLNLRLCDLPLKIDGELLERTQKLRTELEGAPLETREIALELGAPGIILICIFLWWWFKRAGGIWLSRLSSATERSATIAFRLPNVQGRVVPVHEPQRQHRMTAQDIRLVRTLLG